MGRFFHLEEAGTEYICAAFVNEKWWCLENNKNQEPETLEEMVIDDFYLIPSLGKSKKRSLVCSVVKSPGVFAVGIYCLVVLMDS